MAKPKNNNIVSQFRARELAIILSHYDLGAIQEIHRCKRGNESAPKLIITSEKGKYLLKRKPTGSYNAQRIAMSHHCQIYLSQKGFPAPHLVGTNHHHSILQNQNSIYEMFEFVQGHDYDGDGTSAVSAGQCLKNFHDLLKDYTPNEPVPKHSFHNNENVRQRLINFPESDHQFDLNEAQGLRDNLIEAYDKAAQNAQNNGYDQLPATICHGDYHPGNLIFQDNHVIALLDYDSLCLSPNLADIANGCLQFSLVAQGKEPEKWPAELDIFRASCFLKGYRPKTAWPSNELEIIVALMTEALIAEAIAPIAATGMFTNIQGSRFLRMIARKVQWLNQYAHTQLDQCQQPNTKGQ